MFLCLPVLCKTNKFLVKYDFVVAITLLAVIIVSSINLLDVDFGQASEFDLVDDIKSEPACINNVDIIDANINNAKAKLQNDDINMQAYLTKLKFMESSNRHDVVNQIGAIGLYQLTPIAYCDLVQHCNLQYTQEQIKHSADIQEEVQQMYMKRQIQILKSLGCLDYIGTSAIYDGNEYYITKSSLLAAAHLGGPTNVKKWLESGCQQDSFKDGNGTLLSTYSYIHR